MSDRQALAREQIDDDQRRGERRQAPRRRARRLLPDLALRGPDAGVVTRLSSRFNASISASSARMHAASPLWGPSRSGMRHHRQRGMRGGRANSVSVTTKELSNHFAADPKRRDSTLAGSTHAGFP